MNNNYFGATQRIGGSTYLDTRAILHIQEGFQGVKSDGSGSSTEYVDIGDFEISDFNHGGAFRQSLQLNAHALSKRPSYTNSYFSKSFKSAYSYFTDFDDQNEFDQNWTPASFNVGYWGITSGTLQGISVLSSFYSISNPKVSNYRIISKMNATGGITQSQLTLVSHADTDQTSFYMFGYYDVASANGNQIKLYRKYFNDAGSTLLTGISYLIVGGQDYWFMLEEFNGTIKGYYSTDGMSYTLGASWNCSLDDPANLGNNFGVYAGRWTNIRSPINIDSFDVQELGTIYTKEDVIKGGYAMSGVNGVTFAAEISGISYFSVGGIGGFNTYVVRGTSNNIYVKSFTGNSLTSVITMGNTFGDFVAEIEARGASNIAWGTMISSGLTVSGTSANWYGLHSGFGGSSDNVIVHCLGNTRINYRKRGEFWNYKENNWYRLKLIKSGLNLTWEINDQIVNSIKGVSLSGGGTQVALGIFAQTPSLVAGTTAEFRNFRISELDDIIDEVVLEPGSQAQSLIDRVMPNGYAVNNKSGNIEIFKIGDSRGVHDIANTDYLDSDTQDLSNIVGKKYVINKSGDNINIAYSSNSRVTKQADSNSIDIVVDDLNPSQKVALSSLTFANKDVQSVQVGVANRPTLEQYDTINVVDTNLGISKQFLAFNIDKSFSAQDGKFRETLQLNPIEP